MRTADAMRRIYLVIGLLFVALAAIGAALPLIPTVPFLLVAIYCFARSNPGWERRILEHPTFGPQVREWRERRAIPRQAKVWSVLSLLAGVGFTWVTLGFPYAWISIAVLILVGSWIATRPE
ncbi:YbaN family protein [Erythrobacter sp.]|jgi:uncharacterized membrane protein YbaN (DUF454 family)|uniref:YbaN family protein n=1 Tax=Erythrobacter sp. TaxID=1042 RepID=UPI002EB29D3C|nr:YbaN family protein [Erythrobacter sp.]